MYLLPMPPDICQKNVLLVCNRNKNSVNHAVFWELMFEKEEEKKYNKSMKRLTFKPQHIIKANFTFHAFKPAQLNFDQITASNLKCFPS